jgi:hypothetical protein
VPEPAEKSVKSLGKGADTEVVVPHPLYANLLQPSYRSGLDDRSVTELRAMRLDCERAEAAVSFTRRILHGRLDILAGVQQWRRDNAPLRSAGPGDAGQPAGDLADLVEHLPALLADQTSVGGGRPSRLLVTPAPDCVQDDLLRLVDDVVGPATLSSLGEQTDERVEELIGALRAVEQDLSAVRQELHLCIDALQQEITRRYQLGEASLDGLLA